MAKTISDGDHTDFDETRRLLYMALLAPRTKRYNLAGTLVNALVHHHAVDNLNWRDAADKVVSFIEGDSTDPAWLVAQITRISEQLKD